LIRSDNAGLLLTDAAPAKINLTLAVQGRRPDGYHQLESLVVFAGAEASDALELVPGDGFRLELSGSGAAHLAREPSGSNLIEKAVAAVLRAAPRVRGGTFRLCKNLPVAAGIGGGSADAAAALRLVRRSNPDLADGIDWMRLATTISADVPVCLESRASVMEGIGEKVTPLPALPPVWAVIANPRMPLSTADVFRALAAGPLHGNGADATLSRVPTFSGLADLIAHLADANNDLEGPATRLCPVIGEVRALLAGLDGALLARMSGSGPTCFALFAASEAAVEGARWLAAHRPEWWVRATALH